MATKNDTGQQREKTEEERNKFEKEMKEMFNLFDKNHDRSISVDEMGSALRAMGFRMTNKEVRQAVKKIDTNKNGKIEYGEFRNFMMKQYKEQNTDIDSEKQIRQAFKVFDRDGNGCIDKKELRRAMKSMGEPLSEAELDMMMADADANGDGKIDYEDATSKIRPRREKSCLRGFANNTGADQPAHLLSLLIAFVIRF